MKKRNKHVLANLLDSPRWSGISIPILCIILSIIVTSIMLLILGKNPLTAYVSFLRGCGIVPKEKYGGGKGIMTDFCTFLNLLAPMILASEAYIVGSRAGLFNIGISGQMLMGGYFAYIIVGYSEMNAWIAKPMVILIGIVAGGIYGVVVGFLKYKFNIHEVVASILLNYVVSYLTGFSINGWFVDPMTRNSKYCSAASRLSWTDVMIGGVKCSIPMGIFLAIIIAFAVKFLFEKTIFGFELKAVGMNNTCARYTGIKVGSRIIYAMMISGMIAGLAGVCYYTGYTNCIVPKTLSGMGYDAIAVALLGNTTPIGCIFSSMLITIFQNGANYMSSTLGVEKEIASLITGILLLFSACGGYFRYLAHGVVSRAKDDESFAQTHELTDEGKGAQKNG